MQPVSLRLAPSALESLAHLAALTGESHSALLERLVMQAKAKDLKSVFSIEHKKPVCYWVPTDTEAKLRKIATKLDCTQVSVLELLIQSAIDKKQ